MLVNDKNPFHAYAYINLITFTLSLTRDELPFMFLGKDLQLIYFGNTHHISLFSSVVISSLKEQTIFAQSQKKIMGGSSKQSILSLHWRGNLNGFDLLICSQF